jgi:hypothetical protein
MGGIDLLGLGKFASETKEPILKLMSMTQDAIGKIYEPTHVKRMADARDYEIRKISTAYRDNLDVPITYLDGIPEIESSSAADLALRTDLRLHHQELQKERNIEATLRHAYDELNSEDAVSPEPVDKDWSTRFFNIVGEVGNEDMQLLWGKILSGEVKKPGSFSKRTLETMRNLSKTEAETFSRLVNYVIESGDIFFIHGKFAEFIPTDELIFEDILLLSEAGLMTAQKRLGITKEFSGNLTTLKYQDKFIFLDKGTAARTSIVIPCYVLTKAGIEIYKILSTVTKDEYLKGVVSKIKSEGINVSYSQIIDINSNGDINHSDTKIEL